MAYITRKDGTIEDKGESFGEYANRLRTERIAKQGYGSGEKSRLRSSGYTDEQISDSEARAREIASLGSLEEKRIALGSAPSPSGSSSFDVKTATIGVYDLEKGQTRIPTEIERASFEKQFIDQQQSQSLQTQQQSTQQFNINQYLDQNTGKQELIYFTPTDDGVAPLLKVSTSKSSKSTHPQTPKVSSVTTSKEIKTTISKAEDPFTFSDIFKPNKDFLDVTKASGVYADRFKQKSEDLVSPTEYTPTNQLKATAYGVSYLGLKFTEGVTTPFRHPIQTLKGFKDLVFHPIESGKAIKEELVKDPLGEGVKLFGFAKGTGVLVKGAKTRIYDPYIDPYTPEITNVKVNLAGVEGETSIYKGVSTGRRLGGKPLLGYAKGEGVTIGSPYFENLPKINLENPLVVTKAGEGSVVSGVLAKQYPDVYSTVEIANLKNVLKTTELTHRTSSPVTSPKFARENIKSLTPEQFDVVKKFTDTNKGEIYGSLPADALIGGRKIAEGRGISEPKYIGDVDAFFKSHSTESINPKIDQLVKDLNKIEGGYKITRAKEGTLLESIDPATGTKRHAFDIHTYDNPQVSAEASFGFKFNEPKVKIEGSKSMGLSEFGSRKQASILEATKEGFRPPEHRGKDIPDYLTSQEALLKSKGIDPKNVKSFQDVKSFYNQKGLIPEGSVLRVKFDPVESYANLNKFQSTPPIVITTSQSPSVSKATNSAGQVFYYKTLGGSKGSSPNIESPSIVSPSAFKSVYTTYPSPSPSKTPTSIYSPYSSPSGSPSRSPSPSPSISPSIYDSPSPSPSPSLYPSPSPSPSRSPSPSPSPSLSPSPSRSPSPSLYPPSPSISIYGSPIPSPSPSKGGAYGFNVLVRSKGKFQRVNPKPLTRQDAINFGVERVGTTASATFKLQKTGSKVTGGRVATKTGNIQDFYRKQNLFIEKRGRRIKSSGELREITYKGIASPKKKKKRGGRKNGIFF